VKDFKTKAKSGKSKSKPRGKSKSGGNTPGWVMLVSGLVIGGLAGIGAYVFYKNDGSAPPNTTPVVESKPAPKPQTTASTTPKTDTKKSTSEKPRFEFYTLLPEQEVIIPDSEVREQQQRMTEKQSGTYVIQVGSFRHKEDADSLKAKLAFLGIESNIDYVTPNEESWYRVRVGPYTDPRELNRIRNRIHANKMNTLVVKVSG
jgi:cell division protein FtsN